MRDFYTWVFYSLSKRMGEMLCVGVAAAVDSGCLHTYFGVCAHSKA